MMNNPFKPFFDWLIENVILLVVGTMIIIVAKGVQDSSTPLAHYYLSGAIMFSLIVGAHIGRWSRNRK